MKIKITNVGDLCRHCGTPVVLVVSKFKDSKLLKTYFYSHYLRCNKCRAVYMVEKFKIYSKDYKKNIWERKQQSLSFVSPSIQNQSALAQTALSSSERPRVRSQLRADSTKSLSSTELQFKNLMERLQKISDSYSGKKDDTVYCPDCSSKMIKRANNWGKGFWWGCSSFPKCRTTKKDN